jgi:hypothetical protein
MAATTWSGHPKSLMRIDMGLGGGQKAPVSVILSRGRKEGKAVVSEEVYHSRKPN